MITPWRPMDSAPRDGTRILAYDINEGIVVVDWDHDSVFGRKKCWCFTPCEDDYNSRRECFPTHWAPLPEPPSK
jgi:hypothetical protein